ncbi:septum formation inhibitor Maf [Winogradskyella sp. SM1960]|uniref:septum formation inhibitor Maf n=1 Tax=Winogradskyella sp. SM1960 TaxID=2865955 RepID=UPI001CD6FF60|nr:septum formation inhibitor Maf [Winogradskyella sp. SM1960]
MIRMIKPKPLLILITLFIYVTSCKDNTTTTSENDIATVSKAEEPQPKTKLSDDFKNYWYNGEAEITSYKLEQARYGEIREGQAVLVFVTEDFLPKEQVKANNYDETNTPILKFNTTKNFNTGIYPYSIMESTFYPVANNQHALKITASVQEWCGQVYTQVNNRNQFEVRSHSYFQGEADETFNVEKTWTENELWTKLRIDPQSLPVGELHIVPSLEFSRLHHKKLKAHNALASKTNDSYTLYYEDLNRTLKINFSPNFPFEILGWEETIVNGVGTNAETLTSKASILKSIKSDYWNKKSNADLKLRDSLKLH